MEKVLQELFWAYFFGRPYCSNGTNIYLDAALFQCAVCGGGLVVLGIISNQSLSKTACPLCENFGELATVTHNPYSKIILMARYTEILANLGP